MTVAHRAAAAVALAFLSLAPAAAGAPGDLDPSFGGDGVVQAQPGSGGSSLHALALAGNRVLAAGAEDGSDDGCNDLALVRWLNDGTPDPAYGAGGVAVTPTMGCRDFAGHLFRPLALLADADGAAITAGDVTGHGISDGEFVTSHGPTGGLDPGFGGGAGFVQYGDYFHGNINDLVRLPDGRIAAAGLHYGIRNAWAVSRYTAGGARDPSFGGGDGFASYAPDGDQGSLQALVADGDGAVVVAGSLWDAQGGRTPALARIRTDGSLDPDFGEDGIVRVPLEGTLDDIVAAPGGGFVAAGSPDDPQDGMLILKVDASGRLDETFGAAGRAAGPPGHGRAVTVDAAERIVVAGATETGAFAIARLLVNGATDDTFGGGDGFVELPIAVPAAGGFGAADVAVQPDGRIVVGGTGLAGGLPAFTVARLLAADDGNGSPPPPDEEGAASGQGELGPGEEGGAVDAGPVPNRQRSGGRVTIRILRSRVDRRGVLVRVAWPRGTAGIARARLWTRNKGILLGQRRVAVLKGTTSRRFRLPLNRRAKRMLRGGTRLKVRATVRVSGLPARRR